MAEKIGQQIAKEKNLNMTIHSRGIGVTRNEPAHEHAKHAIALYDMDLTKHVSTQFTQKDCSGDTLYLTMTLQHKKYLLQLYPEIEGKIFTLKEYASEQGDVMDPYNSPQPVYDLCAEELFVNITKIFDKIQEEIK